MQTDLVRTRLALTLALLAMVALPACSSGARPGPRASATARPAAGLPVGPAGEDWPEYHGNGARSGYRAGLPAAGPLAVAWSRQLGGAVYGQPLVIGDTVVAATESDQVYGLNRANGAVRWRVRIGTPQPLSQQPCGDINPLGITSTPVYDPDDGLVYVVGQSGTTGHVLAGIRVSDGQLALSRNVPSPDGQAAYDQQRGALALTAGHVYVVFGGHAGDCGPYIGSVVAMPASGTGPVWSYLVPTAQQGGIWAPAGPVVAPSGTIYVSAGNGAAVRPPFDGSDSVIALTPQLRRTGVFAPADWAMLSANDLDLGSTSPALLPGGRILQVGKSAIGYLLNAADLGGVGGQLASGPVCDAFGGTAVAWPLAYVPCPSGLAAVTTTGDRVTVRWRGPAGVSGSPVVGGGAVWLPDPVTGELYELDQADGAVRQRLSLGGPLPHFASPSLSGRLVLVGTMTGIVAVTGA